MYRSESLQKNQWLLYQLPCQCIYISLSLVFEYSYNYPTITPRTDATVEEIIKQISFFVSHTNFTGQSHGNTHKYYLNTEFSKLISTLVSSEQKRLNIINWAEDLLKKKKHLIYIHINLQNLNLTPQI